MAKRPTKKDTSNPRHLSLSALSTLLNRDRNTITKWTSDPSFPVVTRADRETGQSWVMDVADVVKWLEQRAGANAATVVAGNLGDNDIDIEEAKRRKAVADATLAEITLDEKLGQVVLVQEILDQIAGEYAVLRAALQTVGGNVAPQLIGLEAPAQIQAIIDQSIIDALTALETNEGERIARLQPSD